MLMIHIVPQRHKDAPCRCVSPLVHRSPCSSACGVGGVQYRRAPIPACRQPVWPLYPCSCRRTCVHRHYTFYLWRRVIAWKAPWSPVALAPCYAAAAWLVHDALAASTTPLWRVGAVVATALAVVPAGLLELRCVCMLCAHWNWLACVHTQVFYGAVDAGGPAHAPPFPSVDVAAAGGVCIGQRFDPLYVCGAPISMARRQHCALHVVTRLGMNC